jgi:stalled ribosome alternative rescue factor ArfA
MLRSKRRSKKTKGSKRDKGQKPWHPRGEELIPPHKVEGQKKGKGSYDRKQERFDWGRYTNGKYDE